MFNNFFGISTIVASFKKYDQTGSGISIEIIGEIIRLMQEIGQPIVTLC